MNETPEPKRGGRRWMRWAIAILAVLVLLAGAAWVALVKIFPPQRLRAMFAEHASSRLAREVRFKDVRISIWPPVRITVLHPELAEPGGFAEGTAVRAAALHFDLEAFALLARRVMVKRLELVEPALHLVLYPDGTTNFDGLGAGGSMAESGASGGAAADAVAMPVDFLVREFSVRGGKLLVDDLGSERRTALDIETKTSFGISGGRVVTSGDSRLQGLAFGPLTARRLADLNTSLSGLEWLVEHRATIDLASKRMAIERLALGLGNAEAVATGVLGFGNGGVRFDLRARADGVGLKEVLDYLAVADASALHGIEGSGRLAFDVGLSGGIGSGLEPALAGTFSVTEGAFRYPQAPAAVTNLSFTARLGRDSLIVRDVSAKMADQSLRGEVEVIGKDDATVRFAISGALDLGAVSPLFAPESTQVAGRADLDVRGRGVRSAPDKFEIEGRMTLADVSYAAPGLPRPYEGVTGQIDFSKTRARVRDLRARAGASSFTLDLSVFGPFALAAEPGSVPPADVTFMFDSPYLDLAEMLPATPGSPLLPNARGGGQIDIARLKNDKLDVRDVSARVQLEPGVMIARPFEASAYGGTARGEARFDFADPARPQMTVKAHVDSARADSLFGALTGAGRFVKGKLITDMELSASGAAPEDFLRSLTGAGELSILNGVLGPAPVLDRVATLTRMPSLRELRFRDIRTPFRVENGRLLTGPADVRGNFGQAVLTGAVGFDGTLDYIASLTVPKAMVANLGAEAALAAGALSDDQGNVLIDLRISGPAKNPTVSVDQKAVADRLAGKAMNLIRRQGAGFERKLFDALGIGGPTDSLRGTVPDNARADSVRALSGAERQQLESELKNKAQDLLRGFFGSPRDTARR